MNSLRKTLICLITALPSAYATTIILGDTTGNTRGVDAIDIQSYRSGVTQVAAGEKSVTLGTDNTASGNWSMAIGSNNVVSGIESGAFGLDHIISAANASAFGEGITNSIANSTMIGPSDAAKVTILSSGNVGVGTIAPTAKLHVVGRGPYFGQAVFGATSDAGYITFLRGGDGSPQGSIGYSASSTENGEFRITANGGWGYIRFDTAGGGERMRIDSSGNVGIGTPSPSQKLEVAGNLKLTGNIITSTGALSLPTGNATLLTNSGTQTITGTTTFAGTTILGGSTPSQQIKIDQYTGNVGIGTATPSGKLNVANNGQNTNNFDSYINNANYWERATVQFRRARGTIDAPANVASGDWLGDIVFSGYNNGFNNAANLLGVVDGTPGPVYIPGKLAFYTSDGTTTASEKMTLKGNGNVGIGTTSPSAKLHVAGPTNITSFTGTPFMGLVLQGGAGAFTGIDFINTGGGGLTTPKARIAMTEDPTGSFLRLGTSSNWGNGITNSAITINPAGNVGVGTQPADPLHVKGIIRAEGGTPEYLIKIDPNAAISSQHASGESFFYGLQLGSSYASQQPIFKAQTSNANGGVNSFFGGYSSTGTKVFNVNANGAIYSDALSGSGNALLAADPSGNIVRSNAASESTYKIQGQIISGQTISSQYGRATPAQANTVGLELRAGQSSPPPALAFHHELVSTTYLQAQSSPRALRITSGANEAAAGLIVDGALGIGTTSPTSSLTLSSTAATTGVTLYNTTDQATNHERVRQYWSGNTFNIKQENGGIGVLRDMNIGTGGAETLTLRGGFSTLAIQNASPNFSMFRTLVNPGTLASYNATLSNSTGNSVALSIDGNVQQSGTAGYTSLLINPTETSTGSGSRYLADFKLGGISKFNVTSIGNVGIGTGTPTAKLDVFGSNPTVTVRQDPAIAGGATLLLTAAGTASDSNAGTLQLHNAGAIWGRTDGVNHGIRFGTIDKSATWMTLNGANSSLGIGTTAPAEKLEVVGNIKLTGSIMTSTGTLSLPTGNATVLTTSGNQTITGATTVVGTTTLGASTTAQQVKIDGTTGNVGIGMTTAPAGKLHVMQGTTPTTFDREGTGQKITITTDASSNRIQAYSNTGAPKDFELGTGGTSPGSIGLNPGGTRAVTITPNGSVGIGIATPLYPFAINASPAGGLVELKNTNSSGYTGFDLRDNAGALAGNLHIANAAAGVLPSSMWIGTRTALPFYIVTNGTTPRLAVDTAGNVGIGTGTTAPAAKLDVNGTAQFAGDIKVKNRAVIRVSAAGDIGMGNFTAGTNPEL